MSSRVDDAIRTARRTNTSRTSLNTPYESQRSSYRRTPKASVILRKCRILLPHKDIFML